MANWRDEPTSIVPDYDRASDTGNVDFAGSEIGKENFGIEIPAKVLRMNFWANPDLIYFLHEIRKPDAGTETIQKMLIRNGIEFEFPFRTFWLSF